MLLHLMSIVTLTVFAAVHMFERKRKREEMLEIKGFEKDEIWNKVMLRSVRTHYVEGCGKCLMETKADFENKDSSIGSIIM